MMANKRFTMIPLELFEESRQSFYFYHNHQKRGERNSDLQYSEEE